ncbi:MAG: GH3 auxin-responsive promoter family protein [Bacteroidia bacterium]|nr:GH3 auxin-responsive promoter family protein [Bacteroidia bacterium]MCZ2249677.1 GH3 auxin-responsive promoter family protein [Bacteroidia bacterium]
MAIIGSILSRVIELRKNLPKVPVNKSPYRLQKTSFNKLLTKASNTAFGRHYNFERILLSPNPMREFQKTVPIHDYNKMYNDWWHRTIENERNVCWPGTVKYFALSSGTSEAASKQIPITAAMLRSIKRTSIKQLLTLAKYEIPEDLLHRGFLMIGGSTDLNNQGSYFEGDLSGITTSNIPLWFQGFYKPGPEIAHERDWNVKLDKIVKNARNWDIGFIVGVPAWIQIVMERVIKFYQVKNIHEVWPNLTIFVHGGVSFEPYKKGFEALLGKPLIYIETYLASEGFLAYQNRPDTNSMRLSLNQGIFFEFIPFTPDNFGSDGNLVANPKVMLIDEIQEGKEYAPLISTNAGAWRYLIGDTIKFTSKSKCEIIITGRTKHFLSLCGEHLSVENMNNAIKYSSEILNIAIPEYTVHGISHGSLFAHYWYIACDNAVDVNDLRNLIDERLKEINDDYKTERAHALKDVTVEVLPIKVFNDWMDSKGKSGGQHKFPRVMKGALLDDWKAFVEKSRKLHKND